MPLSLPKLSPLQARLCSTLTATLLLLALYFVFSLPKFAYAADVDSKIPHDQSHVRLLASPYLDVGFEDLGSKDVGYEAQFLGHDRGIIGRVVTSSTPLSLENNRVQQSNVGLGALVSYSFLNVSWGIPATVTDTFPSALNRRRLDVEGRGLEPPDLDLERDSDLTERDGQLLGRAVDSTSSVLVLYVSVNVCNQPTSNTTKDPPDQLELYVSESADNTNPGPSADAATQTVYSLNGGYGLVSLNFTGNGTRDVFLGLYGRNQTGYNGTWSIEIAASYDAPYHYYNNDTDTTASWLTLVDSDSQSALFVTNDLTDEPVNSTIYNAWKNVTTAPFVMFATKRANSTIMGVQNSYCGLEKFADIAPTTKSVVTGNIKTMITTTGTDVFPKEQLYVQGLAPGEAYYGILAMNGNSTNTGNGVIGGGGRVYNQVRFNTSATDNCAVVFNLPFCSQTQWAVPANPNNFPNSSALGLWYDDNVKSKFANFEKVIAQIACETTASAQYSLAQNCSSCTAAYKDWLCTVSMPRCTEWESKLTWVQERAMGQPFPNGTFLSPGLITLANQSRALNGSRNTDIDVSVQPGPYKEILPCDDLCYEIVKACPASLGFNCPLPGAEGFDSSYGLRPSGMQSLQGDLTCSYPGAAHYLSAGSLASAPRAVMVGAAVLLGAVLI